MSNTRKVTLNLGESLVARIEDIAAARGIAFNDALLRALARGVKSLEMSAPERSRSKAQHVTAGGTASDVPPGPSLDDRPDGR